MQNILDEYFIKDGVLSGSTRKKSVLLSLERDLAFCVALPGFWIEGNSRNKIQLTSKQYKELLKVRPTFAIISLFCSAVDVIARVSNKRHPNIGENGTFFKNSAQDWFDLPSTHANELWNLRNGIFHSYRLMTGQAAVDIGSGSPVEINDIGEFIFYLHAMYSSVGKAKRKLYEVLSGESNIEKQSTADYLHDNGFFYTK